MGANLPLDNPEPHHNQLTQLLNPVGTIIMLMFQLKDNISSIY